MVAAAAAGSGARVAAEAEGGAETAGRAARHAVAPTIANAAGERAAGGCVAEDACGKADECALTR